MTAARMTRLASVCKWAAALACGQRAFEKGIEPQDRRRGPLTSCCSCGRCSTSLTDTASDSNGTANSKKFLTAPEIAQRARYQFDTRPSQQPAVHDLPLVLTSCLKIQKRRSQLLQLNEEFRRISGAGSP